MMDGFTACGNAGEEQSAPIILSLVCAKNYKCIYAPAHSRHSTPHCTVRKTLMLVASPFDPRFLKVVASSSFVGQSFCLETSSFRRNCPVAKQDGARKKGGRACTGEWNGGIPPEPLPKTPSGDPSNMVNCSSSM